MADARRLTEVGMVPVLAKELAGQITAGVGNFTRLAELSMVPRLAKEVAAQIATPSSASVARLAEMGMVPRLASEVVAQIKGAGVAYTTGLTKANTASARNEWLNGTGNLVIDANGDSTHAGQSTGGGASQAINSWPNKLSDELNAVGIASGANNQFGAKGFYGGTTTIVGVVAGDGRMSYTDAYAAANIVSIGGNAYQATAAGSRTLRFVAVNTGVIFWRDTSTVANSFAYSVDGGPDTVVSHSGVAGIRKTVLPLGSLGTHDITVKWVSGLPIEFGIEAYNSTRREVSIRNMGASGARSANLVSNSDPVISPIKIMSSAIMGTKLAFVECGVINDWRQSITVAASKANIALMVDTYRAAGTDVILDIPVFDAATTGFAPQQQDYVDMMYQLAAEKGIGVFDIRKRWGSYAEALAAGFYSDTVHPSFMGYADKAIAMRSVVQFALAA